MPKRRTDWRLGSFLVSILWSVSCVRGSGQPQQAATGLRDLSRDNLIFTGSDLLWVTAEASVVSCASACVRDPLCVCFTANRTGSGKVECRGHSSQSPQGGVSHPGARLYLLQSPPHPSPIGPPLPTTTALATTTHEAAWLNRTCSGNADCLETNSECFLGICLCTPGYYYSESTAGCLYACSPQQVSSGFIRYRGYFLSGDNVKDFLQKMSISQCMQACLISNTTCLTVNYWLSPQQCGISNVSRFNTLSDELISKPNVDYYQRTCN